MRSVSEETLLVTIKVVAGMLSCSERTVRRLVKEGHLPAPVRLPGGQPRWLLKDVHHYVYALSRGLTKPASGEKSGGSKA